MAKDIILENNPTVAAKSKDKFLAAQRDFLHKFFNQPMGFRDKVYEDEGGRLYRDFSADTFKEGDLIEIPSGTILEYGDLYLDKGKDRYVMTFLVGDKAPATQRYFRKATRMENIEGDDIPFENQFYAG